MTRIYRSYLSELGLTYPQYIVMIVLWEAHRKHPQNQLKVSELSEISKIDCSALSLILSKLISKNYIKTKISLEDRRLKFIHLTTKGLKLVNEAQAIPEKMGLHFNGIKKNDFRQLNQLMKVFLKSVNEERYSKKL